MLSLRQRHIRIPRLALRILGFFPASTSIYASEAVEPNLQRHPYAKMVRHIQGWPTCGSHTLHRPHTLNRLATPVRQHFSKNFTQAFPTSNVTPTPYYTSMPPYAKMLAYGCTNTTDHCAVLTVIFVR